MTDTQAISKDSDTNPNKVTSQDDISNSQQKALRRPRAIDPKIIDDSSDDSDSEQDENEKDDDEQIGPVLPPPPHQPSESLLKAQPFHAAIPRKRPLSPINLDHLPLSNEAMLGDQHTSYVSALSLEPSGTRLVTASLDGSAKLWDFHTMDSSLKSFRTITPLQSDNDIRIVRFSNTGGNLLFAGGDMSAVITDRDGKALAKTTVGDMYLVDSMKTKGHTAAIHTGLWNHTNSNSIVTTSADCTLRMWDIEKRTHATYSKGKRLSQIEQVSIIKLRNEKGMKVNALASDWVQSNNQSNSSICLACSDGLLRLIDLSSYSKRPYSSSSFSQLNPTSIACSNHFIAVRADDSLHLFDARKLAKPIHSFNDLPNTVSGTGVTFLSHDDSFLLTGTSATRKQQKYDRNGQLYLFNVKRMEQVWNKPSSSEDKIKNRSVISVLWNSNVNQIVYGCSDGQVHVLYDEDAGSERGILSCLPKSDIKKRHGIASVGVGPVLSGSEIFSAVHRGRLRSVISGDKDEQNCNVKGGIFSSSKKARVGKQELYKPKAQLNSDKTDGGNDVNGHNVSDELDQDPREAILKYAKDAEDNPQFTKAYEKTQPRRIFADKTAEQEEEESRNAIYERDLIAKHRNQK